MTSLEKVHKNHYAHRSEIERLLLLPYLRIVDLYFNTKQLGAKPSDIFDR